METQVDFWGLYNFWESSQPLHREILWSHETVSKRNLKVLFSFFNKYKFLQGLDAVTT